ncbi:MAG: Ig-like domain-containing protein, partial [Anaerolineae bacterium]|nr:Ig-like domain-containing protein [Anaerolineae bacterium]
MIRKLVLLVCFILALTACENAKPSIVIVSPAHGSQFREGETIAVQSTATDARGVARVELLVDGAVVRLDAAPAPQTTFTLIQTWQATPGTHTLMVRAYNTSGAMSDPAAVSITVSARGASLATPIPTLPPMTPGIATPLPPPTLVSGETPIPTTPAPLPTTPAPLPTTPAPQTGCVGTPSIESFTASPTTISAGGSSTLSWGLVSNADAVEIDQGIGGVATPGSRVVSPATTTTYTLTARCGANIATRQVTIVVGAAFAVTEARMTVASRTYNGTCPTTFDIEGEIRTNGEGTVTYRWERSAIVGGVGSTTLSPMQTANFIGSV